MLTRKLFYLRVLTQRINNVNATAPRPGVSCLKSSGAQHLLVLLSGLARLFSHPTEGCFDCGVRRYNQQARQQHERNLFSHLALCVR
jgi:hypothetical protein